MVVGAARQPQHVAHGRHRIALFLTQHGSQLPFPLPGELSNSEVFLRSQAPWSIVPPGAPPRRSVPHTGYVLSRGQRLGCLFEKLLPPMRQQRASDALFPADLRRALDPGQHFQHHWALNAGVNLRRLLIVVLLPELHPSLRDLSNPGDPLHA